MGLKTTNYKINAFNITLANAYAICSDITARKDSKASATFQIFSNREDALNPELEAIENQVIELTIDKSQGIFEQAYDLAKETIFLGWEDDIVNE